MFKISDSENSAVYTVTNDSDRRIYLNAFMQEFDVDGKEIHKIDYNRENLNEWKARVSPSQLVLLPGFEGRFKVEYNCSSKMCEPDLERVFQVSFIPSPYFEEKSEHQHRVGITIGFAALFVQYSGVDDINYTATLNGRDMTIVNRGQSFIRTTVDYCAESALPQCKMEVNVLAGRDLTFSLPVTPDSVVLGITSAKNQLQETSVLHNLTPLKKGL